MVKYFFSRYNELVTLLNFFHDSKTFRKKGLLWK